jgi:leucyl aminopeptidase
MSRVFIAGKLTWAAPTRLPPSDVEGAPLTTYAYSASDPASVAARLLIVPVLAGPEPGPGAKELGLTDAYRAARLTGKKGEDLLVTRRAGDTFEAEAVLLVGMGGRDDLTADVVRRTLGRVAGTARRFGTVATTVPQVMGSRQAADAVTAAVEGLTLGAYRFDRYLAKKSDGGVTRFTVVGARRWDERAMKAVVKRTASVVESVSWARDLVNTPAGDLPPLAIAAEARAMARATGLTCKVWTAAQLQKEGFGGILGVGQGSVNPPCMIELTYTGAGRATPYALSGKGIAFDSGGLSIKDAKSMETMKEDMAGAASVLATMRSIALLKPQINVIAAIPCSENMPSGSALKPGDVIRHYGGTTSEILNTDAEGRLVLADALAFLTKKRPQLVIDTATLTGSIVVALGERIGGAFGNDRALTAEVVRAGDAVGEPLWEMPMFPDYRRQIDSNVADIRNTGERWGSSITAAFFLSEFVGDTPWVHLDVAGTAYSTSNHDLGPKGATGVPVRTLVRFLEDRADGAR